MTRLEHLDAHRRGLHPNPQRADQGVRRAWRQHVHDCLAELHRRGERIQGAWAS